MVKLRIASVTSLPAERIDFLRLSKAVSWAARCTSYWVRICRLLSIGCASPATKLANIDLAENQVSNSVLLKPPRAERVRVGKKLARAALVSSKALRKLSTARSTSGRFSNNFTG